MCTVCPQQGFKFAIFISRFASMKGGITALLGPSSGGKSLLMKVLTGRMPTVQCTGEVR